MSKTCKQVSVGWRLDPLWLTIFLDARLIGFRKQASKHRYKPKCWEQVLISTKRDGDGVRQTTPWHPSYINYTRQWMGTVPSTHSKFTHIFPTLSHSLTEKWVQESPSHSTEAQVLWSQRFHGPVHDWHLSDSIEYFRHCSKYFKPHNYERLTGKLQIWIMIYSVRVYVCMTIDIRILSVCLLLSLSSMIRLTGPGRSTF